MPNICNPNLLDNWYFGNPVNQRGQTSYAGTNLYTIDRWRFGGYTQTIEVTGNGITWNTNTGVWWMQTIENWDALVGKTATVSALIGGNLYSVSGVVNNSDRISVIVSETVQLEISPEARGVRLVSYVIESTSVGAVLAIKLELGSQQTLAHQENGAWVLNEIPDYGEQLRRCQRYCFAWEYGAQKTACLAVMQCVQPGLLFGLIPTPVTMRATPVVTGASLTTFAGRVTLLDNLITCANGIRAVAHIEGTSTSQGQAVGIENADDNSRVIFSADL